MEADNGGGDGDNGGEPLRTGCEKTTPIIATPNAENVQKNPSLNGAVASCVMKERGRDELMNNVAFKSLGALDLFSFFFFCFACGGMCKWVRARVCV